MCVDADETGGFQQLVAALTHDGRELPQPGGWRAGEVAQVLARLPQGRVPHVGFVGYGGMKPGERVLIAVDSTYEAAVAEELRAALRQCGAEVDILNVDVGPDRDFTTTDEIDATIRDVPWRQAPRRWEGIPWVEEYAGDNGYDLLIHGKGGPTPATDHRYEQIPWLGIEHLEQGAAIFPRDVHRLINTKTWAKIWQEGRGGQVHLTDPEGTDLHMTLHERYYLEPRRGFVADPVRNYGHLHGHPPPPIHPEADATGVIAGTTSHVGRPFPRIRLHLEQGRLEAIEGGGEYGEAWRDLLERTRDIAYPCFPRPGLFWLWELAIGTNPWIRRPRNVHRLSSGGFEWERRRAGVIHAGVGTRWRSDEEAWAGSRGLLYGHMHVHLLLSTYTITTTGGDSVEVITDGHLPALDDADVVAAAERYGDPADLLTEAWIPQIPGLTAAGRYADYAANPEPFIYDRRDLGMR